MSVDANKRLLQQGFEAWNTGDAEFADWAAHAIAPQVIVQVPVLTISGVDAYLNYFRDIRAAFPDCHITLDEMIAEADTLIVLYTFTGTNTGMLLSRPIITGKRASFTTVDVYHFADGKIVKYWQIYDRLALFEQLEALDAAANPIVI